jgi:small conductance mechanosensitive channel
MIKYRRRATLLNALVCAGTMALCLLAGEPVLAQEVPDAPEAPIAATVEAGADTDAAIQTRLERIYAQIEPLSRLEVTVAEGVVTLNGTTRDQDSARQAVDIARRVEGVVAVQDAIAGSVDVGEKVSPFLQAVTDKAVAARDGAPLFLLALLLFGVIAILGWWVASWAGFWRRVSPNPFVGELIGQAIRGVGIVIGIVLALNLIGANALLGTVLGGAGVLGLAIGFAVRDSLENYISSFMLSIRQPFRANDHVVIDGHEGKVVRLTSRATILMTLDGNHLRIPNAAVFKAIILNYTRNPERRFEFELGVDAEDDPQAAIDVGVAALAGLEFVLAVPAPRGLIETVGDSNIVLKFQGWINQDQADFLRARSVAIRAAKLAVEAEGFTLPEPIYRLRIDQLPDAVREGMGATLSETTPAPARPPRAPAVCDDASVAPETHLSQKIEAERAVTQEEDLLNPQRPIE